MECLMGTRVRQILCELKYIFYKLVTLFKCVLTKQNLHKNMPFEESFQVCEIQ